MFNVVGKTSQNRDPKSKKIYNIEKAMKGWEMAQWIKYLPHRSEGLSSDVQNPGKSQESMMTASNTNTWGVVVESPEQAGELDFLNQGSPGFNKRLFSENEVECDQGRHLMSNMSCAHVHIPRSSYTHMHANTHTFYSHIYVQEDN